MSIEGLTQQAAEAGLWRRENPEGLSVMVVTQDPEVARMVAQDLAQALHPDRKIGRVLWVADELTDLTGCFGIEAVVQDMGGERPATGERR